VGAKISPTGWAIISFAVCMFTVSDIMAFLNQELQTCLVFGCATKNGNGVKNTTNYEKIQ
jgi:hypothetical protein